MKRATAAVALVVMMGGLAPAAAAAGGKKRSQPRPRSDAPAAHGPRATGVSAATLRRQVVTHVQQRAAVTAAQPAHTPQHPHAAPAHARHEMSRMPLAPAASARSSGFGTKVLAMLGVGAAAFGTGVVVAAGFAALGAAAPLAAVIGIPSALLLTGAVALISGGMDGPSSYDQYRGDPRNVLRAAASQQQRRRQATMGNQNFPTSPQF
ncbi:MAG TPA: hypothetical protein VMZ28_01640 [Kofleriaceae bacterium]|nr:hypothetical protein [Kofleriaceae bacterium]